MTLKKKGKFWYGTTQEDLRTEMRRYSVDNVYEATRYAASACACGGKTFTLDTDEDAGVALRTCTACGNEHYMGDSASYADEAEPARHPACATVKRSSCCRASPCMKTATTCAGTTSAAAALVRSGRRVCRLEMRGRGRRRLPGGGLTRSRRRRAAQ